MKRILILSIAGLLGITSCQKVIDVDLNSADPQLVIEAVYTAEDSTVNVRVTQTSNYFGSDQSPEINTAVVTISDATGNSDIIPLLGNGNYQLTNYVPQFGTTYSMTVEYNGTTHWAECDLKPVVTQEDIYYEFQEQGFFGGEGGYLAFLAYFDPENTTDHYQAIYTVNGKPRSAISEMIFNDDNLTNGNLVARPIFSEFFELDDTVAIELRTIDADIYQYYEELISLSDAGSAAPANPSFFWTNRALGYFSAYGSSRKETIIQ